MWGRPGLTQMSNARGLLRRVAARGGIASIAIVAPVPAMAQATPDLSVEDGSWADIVVVAQRRPSRADEVAGSIDLVTAKDLTATSTRTFDDLARIDTSLQLAAYQGETQLFVRGLGAVTYIGGFESSVGVYADGVYLSRPSAVGPAFFDLDRVEVLKGPQGSLYGRNATGGAIQLVSRAPSDRWEREAQITLGNYENIDAFAALSGPVSENLSFRLAVGSNNHSGYTALDFGATGSSGVRRIEYAEDRHDLTGRLTIDWHPAGMFRLQVTGDYYKADDRAVVFHFAGPGYANNPLFLGRIGQGDVGPYGRRVINSSLLPFNRPENIGLAGKATVNFPFGMVTSVTAFRRTRPQSKDDLSNSTVLGESQFKAERASQLSEDLTLASHPGADVGYVAGVSFFRERNSIRNEYFFPFLLDYLGGTGTADCCLLKANGTTRTDAFAAFGDLDLPLTGPLRLVAGARWSTERRGGQNLLQFTNLQTINDAPFVPATFSAFTPKLGLRYQLGRSAHLFVTASNGFKSGGYNIGTADNGPYRPEKVWSYEVGGSVELPAAGLSLKGAVFHYDYSDLQVQDVVANSVIIRNAATAKVDGIEMEGRFEPVKAVAIEASGTYLNAHFSKYSTTNLKAPELGVLDLSGNPLPQAPRFKGRLSGVYRLDVARDWTAALRIDALWQGRIYFTAFRDFRATQAPFAWLKARLTLHPSSGDYEFAAFVDNLTNRRVFTNISITGDLDGSRANGNMAPPRTYGIQMSSRF